MPELKEKARQGVPFEELEHAERRLLVEQLATVRAGDLLQALDGINWFKQEHWDKDRLAAVYVLRYFAHEVAGDENALVTFKQWIYAEPLKPLHQWHARYASYQLPSAVWKEEPLTVGRYPNHPQLILVDGYHRAVRFWSINDPAATLAVHAPV